MTNKTTQTATDKRYITSSGAKFLIGSVAGFAAMTIPRMALYLTSNSYLPIQQFFPFNFLMVILIFSLLIGTVITIITIMEYGQAKLPKDTFYTALAVPGLIAGSFNGANSNDDEEYIRLQKLVHQVSEQHQTQEREITVPEMNTISIQELISSPSVMQHSEDMKVSFSLINQAHAATNAQKLLPKQTGLGLAIQREIPQYAISLKRFEDLASAKEHLKDLSLNALPQTAVIVKTADNTCELLLSRELLTKSEALATVLELQQTLQEGRKREFSPSLVKIK